MKTLIMILIASSMKKVKAAKPAAKKAVKPAAMAVKAAKKAAKPAAKAVKEGLSVRQIENYTGTKAKKRRKSSRSRLKSADVRAVEEDLTQVLGTRVSINGSEKRGKIEIEYYSRDELDRIIELLSERAG